MPFNSSQYNKQAAETRRKHVLNDYARRHKLAPSCNEADELLRTYANRFVDKVINLFDSLQPISSTRDKSVESGTTKETPKSKTTTWTSFACTNQSIEAQRHESTQTRHVPIIPNGILKNGEGMFSSSPSSYAVNIRAWAPKYRGKSFVRLSISPSYIYDNWSSFIATCFQECQGGATEKDTIYTSLGRPLADPEAFFAEYISAKRRHDGRRQLRELRSLEVHVLEQIDSQQTSNKKMRLPYDRDGSRHPRDLGIDDDVFAIDLLCVEKGAVGPSQSCHFFSVTHEALAEAIQLSFEPPSSMTAGRAQPQQQRRESSPVDSGPDSDGDGLSGELHLKPRKRVLSSSISGLTCDTFLVKKKVDVSCIEPDLNPDDLQRQFLRKKFKTKIKNPWSNNFATNLPMPRNATDGNEGHAAQQQLAGVHNDLRAKVSNNRGIQAIRTGRLLVLREVLRGLPHEASCPAPESAHNEEPPIGDYTDDNMKLARRTVEHRGNGEGGAWELQTDDNPKNRDKAPFGASIPSGTFPKFHNPYEEPKVRETNDRGGDTFVMTPLSLRYRQKNLTRKNNLSEKTPQRKLTLLAAQHYQYQDPRVLKAFFKHGSQNGDMAIEGRRSEKLPLPILLQEMLAKQLAADRHVLACVQLVDCQIQNDDCSVQLLLDARGPFGTLLSDLVAKGKADEPTSSAHGNELLRQCALKAISSYLGEIGVRRERAKIDTAHVGGRNLNTVASLKRETTSDNPDVPASVEQSLLIYMNSRSSQNSGAARNVTSKSSPEEEDLVAQPILSNPWRHPGAFANTTITVMEGESGTQSRQVKCNATKSLQSSDLPRVLPELVVGGATLERQRSEKEKRRMAALLRVDDHTKETHLAPCKGTDVRHPSPSPGREDVRLQSLSLPTNVMRDRHGQLVLIDGGLLSVGGIAVSATGELYFVEGLKRSGDQRVVFAHCRRLIRSTDPSIAHFVCTRGKSGQHGLECPSGHFIKHRHLWDAAINEFADKKSDNVSYGTQVSGPDHDNQPHPTPYSRNDLLGLLYQNSHMGSPRGPSRILTAFESLFLIPNSPDQSRLACILAAPDSFEKERIPRKTIANTLARSLRCTPDHSLRNAFLLVEDDSIGDDAEHNESLAFERIRELTFQQIGHTANPMAASYLVESKKQWSELVLRRLKRLSDSKTKDKTAHARDACRCFVEHIIPSHLAHEIKSVAPKFFTDPSVTFLTDECVDVPIERLRPTTNEKAPLWINLPYIFALRKVLCYYHQKALFARNMTDPERSKIYDCLVSEFDLRAMSEFDAIATRDNAIGVSKNATLNILCLPLVGHVPERGSDVATCPSCSLTFGNYTDEQRTTTRTQM